MDPSGVTIEPPNRGRGRDIPQENRLVPAAGDEARVIGGDGEIEDFVAVGVVGLNELRGVGVVEADDTVLGACEEVLAGSGGEGKGVDRSLVY